MIKAIAFDFGGVYFRFGGTQEQLVKGLARLTGVPGEIAFKATRTHINEFNLGKITEKQYYNLFCKEIGKDIPIARLREFNDKYYYGRPNTAVVSLVKRLRKRYTIAMLANQNVGLDRADRRFHFYKEFDIVISSHKVRMRKPEKRIFDLLLKKAKAKPHEVVFIDDTKHIVEAAGSFGINAIHFQNAAQLKRELAKHGVTP